MSVRKGLSEGIARLLRALSRGIAWVTPWLFLALHRALIATLAAAVVAVMFFVVPQSREVLHGLGEPPLRSLQEFNAATSELINLGAYVWYVLTAVALGFATWYAARLLATVDAQLATPAELAVGNGHTRLRTATTWLPRALGVFVLAAAIGALFYASYTPRLAQGPALALAVLAVAGPLVAAAGSLAGRKPVWWLGITATLAATALLVQFTDKWRLWLVSIACSTLPGILLWFLVKRRDILAGRQRQRAIEAHQQRAFGDVLVTLLIVVVLCAGALALLAFLPAAPVRAFGSAAAVLMFLAAAVLFLAGVQIVLRGAARNVPGLTSAGLMTLAVMVALVGDESLGDERLDEAPRAAATNAASGSAAARPFYVNAHGGGLRAAIFTAQILARADDATCGDVGEQVAAFSGVSGGSLGIATYLVARQEHMRHGGWEGCTPGAPTNGTPLTDIVVRALVQDHLSPTVARMLTVDALHLPWSPARGQALLDSWQSALVVSLVEARADKADGAEPAAFALRLGELTGGLPHPVAVYFNATDADSGHIVWFSNRDGGLVRRGPADSPSAVSDVTVGQAVLHSARFPIVSPAGRFGSQRLVDGGYADNSGTTTLLRAMREDKRHDNAAPAPRLINIDGNAPDESPCPKPGDKLPILTALRALLQARSAHAELAVQEFELEPATAPALDVMLDLEKTFTAPEQGERCEQLRRAHHASLGWYMSYGAAKTIAASVDYGTRQICDAMGTACALEDPAKGVRKAMRR